MLYRFIPSLIHFFLYYPIFKEKNASYEIVNFLHTSHHEGDGSEVWNLAKNHDGGLLYDSVI